MTTNNLLLKNTRLAVNLADLDRLGEELCGKLLAGRIDLQLPIRPDSDVIMVSGVRSGDPEEAAVFFVCDLLMAAQLLDMIRGRDFVEGDNPTRIYIQRKAKGPWERLPGTAVLTEKVRGKLRLSTKIFPVEVSPTTMPTGMSGVSL